SADDVDDREGAVADEPFDDRPDLHQHEQVHAQMWRAGVEEHRGEQPPPLAAGDVGCVVGSPLQRVVRGGLHGSAPALAVPARPATLMPMSKGTTHARGVRSRNAPRKSSKSTASVVTSESYSRSQRRQRSVRYRLESPAPNDAWRSARAAGTSRGAGGIGDGA